MIQQNPSPTEFTANNVVLRIVDTLEFRYQCALLDLKPSTLKFRPSEEVMTFQGIVDHILDMLNSIHESCALAAQQAFEAKEGTFETHLKGIRAHLVSPQFDPNDFEIWGKNIWFLVSGPLLDIMTHIGQLNTYRALADDRCLKKVDHFEGTINS